MKKIHKEIVAVKRGCGIPLDKLEEYEELFNKYDKNQRGTISSNDLSKILNNKGYQISRDEIEEMVKNYSEYGEIDFEGFFAIMDKQEINDEMMNDKDVILNAFKSFDKTHEGKISTNEFRYILTKLGNKFTEEECDMLFKECDLDNDGFLLYNDFVNFWIGK